MNVCCIEGVPLCISSVVISKELLLGTTCPYHRKLMVHLSSWISFVLKHFQFQLTSISQCMDYYHCQQCSRWQFHISCQDQNVAIDICKKCLHFHTSYSFPLSHMSHWSTSCWSMWTFYHPDFWSHIEWSCRLDGYAISIAFNY